MAWRRIGNDADQIHWRKYATLRGDELNYVITGTDSFRYVLHIDGCWLLEGQGF